MDKAKYTDAISLLQRVRSPLGFLASASDTDNYHRVWARDGVICGLAALATGHPDLCGTFAETLRTLANAQHATGTIPSNVGFSENGERSISYGGLAGRVDNASWFVIGVCHYAISMGDYAFAKELERHLRQSLALMQAWEFNNRHLMYVPLSGNWADEYITEGYTLYDQLLRVWALRLFARCFDDEDIRRKADAVSDTILYNFTVSDGVRYHEKAYESANFSPFAPCCFTPAGYKPQFDAFAHSLFLLLGLWPKTEEPALLRYCQDLAKGKPLGMLPAFWPPVRPKDAEWPLLEHNCKYAFRNFPYEFHNGGTWPMVNGFYGMALVATRRKEEAVALYDAIAVANAKSGNGFYENFHTVTGDPIGVAHCSWSAAGQILLHQTLFHDFKFYFT